MGAVNTKARVVALSDPGLALFPPLSCTAPSTSRKMLCTPAIKGKDLSYIRGRGCVFTLTFVVVIILQGPPMTTPQ